MSLTGKVLTVNGVTEAADLGPVLPHEHLLLYFENALMEAEYGLNKDLRDLTFELKNLGKIRHFPYSVLANLSVKSSDDIISELQLYRQAGGGTVCDVTPNAARCTPELLPEISTQSDVKIVVGTATYVDTFIPDDVKKQTVEQLADTFINEVEHGISGTAREGRGEVRCGIIGEMGCSYPLTEAEERGLKAAALAQKKTGAPLIIHPGRDEESPFRIMEVLRGAGADIGHTVMSHLDRTIYNHDRLLEFARSGCYLEYDLFGLECAHYQFCRTIDFPNDGGRIAKVKFLVENGFADKVLIAHDIHTKHRLVKYGGHGYAHILDNIVPKMIERGISEEDVRKMTEYNAQQWLKFK